MKYLKYINENIQELSSEYLVDLFTLNLEDNVYFDASNISAKYTYSKPVQVNPNKSIDYYDIFISETFTDTNDNQPKSIRKSRHEVYSINMKVLSHICKKYDLFLENLMIFEYDKSVQNGAKTKLYFTVSQLH